MVTTLCSAPLTAFLMRHAMRSGQLPSRLPIIPTAFITICCHDHKSCYKHCGCTSHECCTKKLCVRACVSLSLQSKELLLRCKAGCYHTECFVHRICPCVQLCLLGVVNMVASVSCSCSALLCVVCKLYVSSTWRLHPPRWFVYH